MSYGRTQPSAGPVEGAIHGAVVYLGVTIGSFLTVLLSRTVGSTDSVLVTGTEDNVFAAASTGFNQLLILAPLIAIGLTIFYVASDRGEPALVPAAVGAAVGTILSGLLMILVIFVVAPDIVDVDIVSELIALGTITVGSVVAAFLSALGFDLV